MANHVLIWIARGKKMSILYHWKPFCIHNFFFSPLQTPSINYWASAFNIFFYILIQISSVTKLCFFFEGPPNYVEWLHSLLVNFIIFTSTINCLNKDEINLTKFNGFFFFFFFFFFFLSLLFKIWLFTSLIFLCLICYPLNFYISIMLQT